MLSHQRHSTCTDYDCFIEGHNWMISAFARHLRPGSGLRKQGSIPLCGASPLSLKQLGEDITDSRRVILFSLDDKFSDLK